MRDIKRTIVIIIITNLIFSNFAAVYPLWERLSSCREIKVGFAVDYTMPVLYMCATRAVQRRTVQNVISTQKCLDICLFRLGKTLLFVFWKLPKSYVALHASVVTFLNWLCVRFAYVTYK